MFKICAREICEKFVYEQSETIGCVENWLIFQGIYKLHGKTIQEFLGFRIKNFQDIVFIWTQIYMEIFKSPLVYL